MYPDIFMPVIYIFYSMTEIITEIKTKNITVDILKNRTIGVIGYGNQGKSQALNMRDSGLNVIIGNPKDSYLENAVKDGFKVYNIEEACKKSDIIFILIPDEIQKDVFESKIMPNLKEGNTVVMASGYNYFYGFLKPPEEINIIMIAPRMIGWGLRDLYKRDMGFPVLAAIGNDHSGDSRDVLLGLCDAIGVFKESGCAIMSSFREETLVDLLSEQSWAGAILFIFRKYFEVATELGASPEVAILEMYASGELAEIAESMKDIGLFRQLKTHSRTSQYGQLTRGPEYAGEEITNLIKRNAMNILNGIFAREWTNEQMTGEMVFQKLHEINQEHPMELAERSLYKLLGRDKND